MKVQIKSIASLMLLCAMLAACGGLRLVESAKMSDLAAVAPPTPPTTAATVQVTKRLKRVAATPVVQAKAMPQAPPVMLLLFSQALRGSMWALQQMVVFIKVLF